MNLTFLALLFSKKGELIMLRSAHLNSWGDARSSFTLNAALPYAVDFAKFGFYIFQTVCHFLKEMKGHVWQLYAALWRGLVQRERTADVNVLIPRIKFIACGEGHLGVVLGFCPLVGASIQFALLVLDWDATWVGAATAWIGKSIRSATGTEALSLSGRSAQWTCRVQAY